MAKKRHLSRVAVMQVLFARETRSTNNLDTLEQCAVALGSLDDDFAQALLTGVLNKEDELKRIVEEDAPDWSLERMDPIARCTLLIGAYELRFANDAPPAVVMNEAIEIAKEYGSAESGKFVNGVLNAIAHGSESVNQ